MRIEWSPQARDDLADIYLYIATDNIAAARRLHEQILAAIDLLAATPHIGRPGRVAGTREMVIAGTPYIIPYRVTRGMLQLIRVYHHARQWPEAF